MQLSTVPSCAGAAWPERCCFEYDRVASLLEADLPTRQTGSDILGSQSLQKNTKSAIPTWSMRMSLLLFKTLLFLRVAGAISKEPVQTRCANSSDFLDFVFNLQKAISRLPLCFQRRPHGSPKRVPPFRLLPDYTAPPTLDIYRSKTLPSSDENLSNGSEAHDREDVLQATSIFQLGATLCQTAPVERTVVSRRSRSVLRNAPPPSPLDGFEAMRCA